LTVGAHIGSTFGDYAGFVPGLAISIILALLLGGSVARRLGTTRMVATLLILSLGVVLSATVTPSRDALMGMPKIPAGCDLSRVGLAPWREYVHVDDTSLNVLLFIPLGAFIGVLPRSPYRWPVAVAAIILPFAIEGFQLVVTPLGRACQSADVVDNLLGLTLGLVAGLTAAWVGRRASSRPARSGS
jgi:glycopeptide antibiotics resistance protein